MLLPLFLIGPSIIQLQNVFGLLSCMLSLYVSHVGYQFLLYPMTREYWRYVFISGRTNSHKPMYSQKMEVQQWINQVCSQNVYFPVFFSLHVLHQAPKCSRDACISRMPFNSWRSGTSYKVSIALYFTKRFQLNVQNLHDHVVSSALQKFLLAQAFLRACNLKISGMCIMERVGD